MKNLKPVLISGKEVLPLIEGGKGINATDGFCSGSWAKENCVGTFSGVLPDMIDENGVIITKDYQSKMRPERHEEMIERSIQGSIDQAKIAYETANGNGRIHMNMMWEFGGAEKIINGVLEKTKGILNGITCGAGLPYRLGEIATRFETYYYPIISSARAFQVLWKRSFKNFTEFLGGVVYEDPWLAGGHNGLSNAEDPKKPQSPYQRLADLRKIMNEYGLNNVPIVIAGGVWSLNDWKDYIDNPDIGKVAFQLGTRPLLTKESPISDAWKKLLTSIKPGDIISQSFSPTGFLSTAFKNNFLQKLLNRKETEMVFSSEKTEEYSEELKVRNKSLFVEKSNAIRAQEYVSNGLTEIRETPDNTIVFMNNEEWKVQQKDRVDCVGCLSQCMFSAWHQVNGSTGKVPDPRSYCIKKTLSRIGHGEDPMEELLFAGTQATKFASDPLFQNGNIPSVKELIQAVLRGE